MRKLQVAIVSIVLAISAPAFAQTASAEPAAKPSRLSSLRLAISEAVIQRCRSALRLNAEQERYWPAVAHALRALAREPNVTEEAVRRIAPAVSPLLATLDDQQRQTAMNFAHKVGLTQYASLF